MPELVVLLLLLTPASKQQKTSPRGKFRNARFSDFMPTQENDLQNGGNNFVGFGGLGG